MTAQASPTRLPRSPLGSPPHDSPGLTDVPCRRALPGLPFPLRVDEPSRSSTSQLRTTTPAHPDPAMPTHRPVSGRTPPACQFLPAHPWPTALLFPPRQPVPTTHLKPFRSLPRRLPYPFLRAPARADYPSQAIPVLAAPTCRAQPSLYVPVPALPTALPGTPLATPADYPTLYAPVPVPLTCRTVPAPPVSCRLPRPCPPRSPRPVPRRLPSASHPRSRQATPTTLALTTPRSPSPVDNPAHPFPAPSRLPWVLPTPPAPSLPVSSQSFIQTSRITPCRASSARRAEPLRPTPTPAVTDFPARVASIQDCPCRRPSPCRAHPRPPTPTGHHACPDYPGHPNHPDEPHHTLPLRAASTCHTETVLPYTDVPSLLSPDRPGPRPTCPPRTSHLPGAPPRSAPTIRSGPAPNRPTRPDSPCRRPLPRQPTSSRSAPTNQASPGRSRPDPRRQAGSS